MKLYLDTEFNGFNGSLISMALVSQDGREWYEVLGCEYPCDWVKEHVMPILQKNAVSRDTVQQSLKTYLSQWPKVCIVADWPEDIKHFCDLLITAPGEMIGVPSLSFEIKLNYSKPEIPHNALSDARAFKKEYHD